ncbi:DUF6918 family protein [Phytoactinopolyspora mesophila]|uniref:Uncharacterized protein n=1 Tax=Phytoactinopolyspora mesophila TaxID=2650750 RepID=A0A7K3M9Y1_9ACTN|nr:hypothetical protein [Phytoactinopolyspora mesophila]NDL60093.1 hypothetical protein [Phytoactinopolyspora mesophila]
MADTLQEILLAPDRRPAVVKDVENLVDAEVAGKSGVSGLAVKSGYGLIKKINSTFVSDAVDSMLDNFVARLEPYYAEHVKAGSGSFADRLTGNSSDVADALLGVTDDRAAGSRRDSVKKVYSKLRPQAKKHVEEALPRLGELIDKHAAAVNAG